MEQLVDLGNNPEDALSMILLLDQMPRNIYRGDSARIAYEETDPRALELAKLFTRPPKDYDARQNWTNWWQQYFFYLPCP